MLGAGTTGAWNLLLAFGEKVKNNALRFKCFYAAVAFGFLQDGLLKIAQPTSHRHTRTD